jgi:hypothetical protein
LNRRQPSKRRKHSSAASVTSCSFTPRKLRCDTHHAGIQGKYLAAAVWFEFLTGLNPHAEGIRAGAISDEDAKFLSDIAHQVVTKGKRAVLEKTIPAQ